MKVEIASMLNFENRNCKYACLWKFKLNMLNYEDRNSKQA